MRDPNMIADAEPIDAYFGDVDRESEQSIYLAKQMRRYSRIGDLNSGAASAQLLSAYCYWRLGDMTRAREYAARAEEMALDEPGDSGLLITFARAFQRLK
jgi:hypothetical protein